MCFCYDLSVGWTLTVYKKGRKLSHLKKFQPTFLALSFNNKREVLKHLHHSHWVVSPYKVHYPFNLPLFSKISFLHICWNDVHSSALSQSGLYLAGDVLQYSASSFVSHVQHLHQRSFFQALCLLCHSKSFLLLSFQWPLQYFRNILFPKIKSSLLFLLSATLLNLNKPWIARISISGSVPECSFHT